MSMNSNFKIKKMGYIKINLSEYLNKSVNGRPEERYF